MLMGVTARLFTTGAGAKADDPPIKAMERRDKSFMVGNWFGRLTLCHGGGSAGGSSSELI
jgi:hypothetical protein